MISRRRFLSVSSAAGGGLLVGFQLSCKAKEEQQPATSAPVKETEKETEKDHGAVNQQLVPSVGGASLNAWIHIAPNDVVTLRIPEAEMGQGVLTGLSMILAEHLEADFAKVRAEHAPANQKLYGRQSTGGSTSVRMGYEGLAAAAATARDLLVAAGAKKLGVATGDLEARASVVRLINGETSVPFGELADAAAEIDLGKDYQPTVKDWKEHTLIGTAQRRLDTYDKVTGKAAYGLDVRVDGMLTAQVLHAPSVGGTVVSVKDDKARAIAGVRDVVQVPTGVAVLGDHFWAAKKGKEALDVTWKEPHERLDNAEIHRRLSAALDKGAVAREDGRLDLATARGDTLEAEYEVPYLAHAPMEPLSCTAKVANGGCELWVSTQSPTNVQIKAAEILGLDPAKVVVHSMMLGGGFGRRSNTDYVEEAVHVAKKTGKTVKLVWEREDDIRGYRYRPAALNRLRGGVGKDGIPDRWEHAIASPSILKQFSPVPVKIDKTSVEGASNLPYAIPNLKVTYADVDLPVSVWFWRSVGSSQNAYVTECFFDELCSLRKKDPVEARLALLEKHPRHAKVLTVAAEKAGWGKSMAAGQALGVAVHESFGSIVAEVATVSMDNNRPRVHKVVCVVDPGRVINPDTIAAQMDSGIVYGLSAALYGDIRFDKGRVVQGNFDTYRALRMAEMPRVETHIVESGEKLGGIGEPATPPIAPAVVNGLFALTGKPIRKLPISAAG